MKFDREKVKVKPWCLHCDTSVNFKLETHIRRAVVKGVEIKSDEIVVYCDKCGRPVFLYDAEKINQIKLYDAYKRKKGLLTTEEIIEIRKKYGLSQTELAKAIKVGKKNIARYELGGVQDACIDLLIRLLDKHPELFGIK